MSDGYEPDFFDPLSTADLTNIVCHAFERQPLVDLYQSIERFEGSGLYAIYYRGSSLPLYAPLARLDIPVYVGQAVSKSATGRTAASRSPLFKRLGDHRTSIAGAGLPLAEFAFRALLMPSVHADLGEDGLRRGYRPVWNSVLNGFGGREQGQSTRQSARSKWDTVHEGRNRTFGIAKHDPAVLREEVTAHILEQVATYDDLPWR
ncbi:Eco29kI family restriction endonuclease [Streptomyces sp. BI20]|uniref:Eco29kI family restriction endonuclease n=1 Tax=Streptomyces sp. BI20 TaxID=3403460 RepID=UPI003C7767C6